VRVKEPWRIGFCPFGTPPPPKAELPYRYDRQMPDFFPFGRCYLAFKFLS
jgi:hypothetical protein